jgi:predicted nucleotidyltransferase component of viral defense system
MLQKQTVEPGTLDILMKLMKLPVLSDFLLVGGTALSLQYGHRISVDLDLFSTIEFDNQTIVSALEKEFPGFTYRNVTNPIGLFGYIDDIKVDFVKYHHHPVIKPPSITEGIRFMSTPDIIAMKINAILKRGVKKDLWDIAELLNHYTLSDFIKFYHAKFPSQQLLISIPQAITYFDDAEETEDPISLKDQTWESVKKIIQQKVRDFLS